LASGYIRKYNANEGLKNTWALRFILSPGSLGTLWFPYEEFKENFFEDEGPCEIIPVILDKVK
jgi:hypothetical protein